MGGAASTAPKAPEGASAISTEEAQELERQERLALFKGLAEIYDTKRQQGASDDEIAESLDVSLQTSSMDAWNKLQNIVNASTQLKVATSPASPPALEEQKSEASFESSCLESVQQIAGQAWNAMVVAVDDSAGSELAFNTALELRKGEDTVHVIHVEDEQLWGKC